MWSHLSVCSPPTRVVPPPTPTRPVLGGRRALTATFQAQPPGGLSTLASCSPERKLFRGAFGEPPPPLPALLPGPLRSPPLRVGAERAGRPPRPCSRGRGLGALAVPPAPRGPAPVPGPRWGARQLDPTAPPSRLELVTAESGQTHGSGSGPRLGPWFPLACKAPSAQHGAQHRARGTLPPEWAAHTHRLGRVRGSCLAPVGGPSAEPARHRRGV